MYDLCDISLIPRVISTIDSRSDISINIPFKNKFNLSSPIIASPMKDVCDGKIAKIMWEFGGLGIIHRFNSIENQAEEYEIAHCTCACAIGINGDYFDRFNILYDNGCRIFCIDTANGASSKVEKVINNISRDDVSIIVGNVASRECYEWLEQFDNVVAIRCGIAGGNACTTKNATGIYHPMVSCIRECAEVKKRTLLIADGGIKEPADMCKAIALGADLVMLGTGIANTSDSPAEIIKRDGKLYKVYHGSASFEIQKEYREAPRYIEGRTKILEYDGESLEALITRFGDGLRSCMSYFNARSLDEFRKNVSYGH